jgi:PAS domain S-box-containing protein
MDGSDLSEPTSSGDERYRLLVEAVTDYAIYMLDPTGIVASWNPGAQRFKGYAAHEIIGSHFSKFYTEADKAIGAPQRNLDTAVREGRYEDEGWRVRKDGVQIWTHVVIDPIRTPAGELLGFAKITRDLSEKRAADMALRESEERFRLLVQGVADYAICMLDPAGHVSNWNAGAARIKGYTADEIIGRHFSEFYTPEEKALGAPQRNLDTAIREGQYLGEGWRTRKDGSRFFASVAIDAIHNDRGELLGFAKITRDITERVEAQRQLDAARESFFQSQKMEAIGQLTGGVAHDFNNLLAAVLGSLELLRKRLPESDPKAFQLLDNAVQAGKRGAALTQRMLAFARRQDLQPKPVDTSALVLGLRDLLERTLGPNIRFRIDMPRDLPPALTDANQLELALLNLAVNARDAMPEGGEIRIVGSKERVGEGDDPALEAGNYVRLSVIDTGAGMDAETLERAIEPFFTTKGIGKGTGLGLSMVQGLVEQQGGRLSLSSAVGKGTTVELWLPVAAAMAEEAAAAAAASEECPAVHPRTSLNILAVDDDPLILMNTVAMLQDMGHTVFEASSGAKALELLGSQPVDLVITDQAMPHMTGAELMEAARAKSPSLRFILATGYAELPVGAAANLSRLAKPFDQTGLATAIRRTMDMAEVG